MPFIARGVRAKGQADTMAALNATALGVSFIEVADPYQSVSRSVKYVLLFLGLLFLSYFVFEVTTGKRVHPAQYVLVGMAQLIFYLLLLSLAERVGFDFGFLLAGAATVGLLSANAAWIFNSRLQGVPRARHFLAAVCAHLSAAAAGRQCAAGGRGSQLPGSRRGDVFHARDRLVQLTARARPIRVATAAAGAKGERVVRATVAG